MTADDRYRLRELVEAYALAVDRRDAASVAALFAPTGELALFMEQPGETSTGLRRGRAEITTALAALARYRATHHTISSTHATIDGDTAAGETRCVAHHVEGERGSDVDHVLYLHYLDSFVRLDGEWRFSCREVHARWSTTLPVDP